MMRTGVWFALGLVLLAGTCATWAQPASVDAYLKMLDADGDGRVSEAEYVAWMMRGFEAMDSNGDGVLDESEMPPSPRQRGALTRADYERNLVRTFRRQDLNHDGYLDARELSEPPH